MNFRSNRQRQESTNNALNLSTIRTAFGLGTRIRRETKRLSLWIRERLASFGDARFQIANGLVELLQADRVCGLRALKRVRLEWIQFR